MLKSGVRVTVARAPRRRVVGALVCVLGVLGAAAPAHGQTPIQPPLFGQHLGSFHDWSKTIAPAPEAWGTKAIRLWDAGVAWCHMQPDPNKPIRWAKFDEWLGYASSNGMDVVYTFGRPPGWAQGLTGGCDTSSNSFVPDRAAFRQFVRALVARANGRLKYWEIWNEWDGSWPPGRQEDMAAFARIAAEEVHGANQGLQVLTPSVTSYDGRLYGQNLGSTLESFLTRVKENEGVIDIINVHTYMRTSANGQGWPDRYLPEWIGRESEVDDPVAPNKITPVRTTMHRTGYAGYPLWSTEGSWGKNESIREYGADSAGNNASGQRAFVARYYLTMLSLGVERAYWYAYSNPSYGTLWQAGTPLQPGGLTPGGGAMNELVRTGGWLNGATFDGCNLSQQVRSCDITRPDGRRGRILWAEPVQTGLTVERPTGYTTLRRLTGTSEPASPTIPIGHEPILLEQ